MMRKQESGLSGGMIGSPPWSPLLKRKVMPGGPYLRNALKGDLGSNSRYSYLPIICGHLLQVGGNYQRELIWTIWIV
jgi:hypothetical protein